MTNSINSFIVDSGADISIMKVKNILPNQLINKTKQFNITGVTDGIRKTLAETTTSLHFSNGLVIHHNFQLVDVDFPVPTDGILGRDFLTKFKCTIDYEHWLLNFRFQNHEISVPIEDNYDGGILIPPRCEVIRKVPYLRFTEDTLVHSQEIQPGIFCGNTIVSKDSPYVKFINTTERQVLVQNFTPKVEPLNNFIKVDSMKDNRINDERIKEIISQIKFDNVPHFAKNELRNIILKYQDIFSLPNDRLSTNNFYSQNIELKDRVPVYIPNYKNIHSQNDEMQNQIQKMVDDGIIEPSVSPYNSPILLVPKKSDNNTKKWRLVVDFRQLNKKVLADKFPLPRIDTILDQLGRAKYFTTLDLMSGFHQIPLDQNSRKYTAFSSASGHFQFSRLPFGLNISPNSFQRMMNIAMAGLTPECAFVYIDDIVVIGCSVNHHFANLSRVFERLRHYNLKLNPTKCNFFCTEVTYLGHKITDHGILPDDSKFKVIKDFPRPTNPDEVRRFVAFCNYYRKFVPDFANVAKPLNDLLKKNIVFEWTQSHEESFNKLKRYLMSPQILRYPDFNKEFVVTTDASDFACGAILSQRYADGDFPIAYASKSFTKGESNKPIIEKELIAIHWAIDYFRPYLYGRRFKVRTDHRPLVYLFGMKKPTSRLTRIRLDLEEFDFDIEFVPGKANVGADALSRIITKSEELKTMCILTVNTRAMTRKKISENTNKQLQESTESHSQIDHLAMWQTENPSEVHKVLKLSCEVHHNQLKIFLLNHNYKKILQQISITHTRENGSQTLEFALLEIQKYMKIYKRDKVALSLEDEIFDNISVNTLKEIANKAISTYSIILYKPPKFIENSEEINKILSQYHMTPTGGHVGQHRLYLKIREQFKWKNMKNDIASFVKNCTKCKINKTFRHTKEAEVVTTTPAKPLEILSIDTAGPFVRTAKGNRYILTIQCNLTKYVVLIPVPTKEAAVLARALVYNFILIYGSFLELRTDQGSEYNNEVLEQICKLLEIKQTFSTAYHPQSIGALERNHRCLNEYLRCFTNTHQNDWDDWVKFYEFTFNTTPHTEHGFSPYELVFGRKARLPYDSKTDNVQIDPLYNFEQYDKELKFRLQNTNTIARQNLISNKIKRQTISNNNINPICLHIGESVYIKNENRKKLDPFYIGPYIIETVEDPNCTIRHPITNKKTLVHKNRVIKSV